MEVRRLKVTGKEGIMEERCQRSDLTAALKTFKYQENWINYRTTCETLKKEKYLYDAGLSDYQESVDREAQFVDRLEALLVRENSIWPYAQKKNK
jgi:hypothetical protein